MIQPALGIVAFAPFFRLLMLSSQCRVPGHWFQHLEAVIRFLQMQVTFDNRFQFLKLLFETIVNSFIKENQEQLKKQM